ncbi:MAG: prolyl aminopeptidase [Sphaerobacteraceae bacterium]|nr:MAG: prolyl aminopeptidase [Sphaerobacteraceae bacterium]
MSASHPVPEPLNSGTLSTSDGHEIYWESVGNPDGAPIVYLHGGPGSGATPGARRFFDPDQHHAILFDQRGSGRSRPLASEPDADLSTNTTAHLIGDIEELRELLGIERWTVFGLSWGTTLGLAYAQRFPDRVSGLVLGFVTNTSRREVEWVTEAMGRVFPEEWDRFRSTVPADVQHLRLVDAYAEMLFDPDPDIQELAAREWCRWEDTHVSLMPGARPNPRYEDPTFRLQFARLVTHYWRNAAFLEDGELLQNADRLSGIPGVMIHGRYDISGPLDIAWNLNQRWLESELQVIDDAGHGGGSTFEVIADALRRVAREP